MKNDGPEIVSRKKINWTLLLGWILVLGITFLAFAGPTLAPSDPLERSSVIRVSNKFLTPPYPLLTPGFPLGSDGLGRDLLSRILWGLRPTMTMVLVVASVRLFLGTLIGLVAGWSTGWPANVLDSVISAALSIPIIIVALFGIAAVGVEMGIWAFIAGLALTGWVETARLVREQTRAARGQAFIEAAHAMGASPSQVLRSHILPQVLPMLWMLLAFEISGTLMLTAALGFLGYYIGGDVWVQVTDSVAAAVSGTPELGQMLATVKVSPARPWGLIILGALVFVVVLSFTLLGEGLRRRLSLYGARRQSLLGKLIDRFRFWSDEHIWWPVSNFPRTRAFRPVLAALALVLMGISVAYWGSQFLVAAGEELPASAFPQEQLWSTARHDPFGTLWSQALGPTSPDIAWTFEDQSGFTGGVAVTKDGTVLVTSNNGVLYALDPAGELLWQVDLPKIPVGSPALDENGDIYISDQPGGLSKLSMDGGLLWHFDRNQAGAATTTTGPVVSPDGPIYYVVQREIVALSPQGQLLWSVKPPGDTPPTKLIQIGPEGKFLIWGNVLVDAGNGSVKEYKGVSGADAYFVGANGENYLVEGHEVSHWMITESGAQKKESVSWDYQKFTIARTPQDLGVTPNGTTWLFYTGFARTFGYGQDTRIIWLDKNGSLMGNLHYETRNSKVIAVDQKGVVYSCGNLDFGYGDPDCQAFSPGSEEPIWNLKLKQGVEVTGGAVVPGREYVATRAGFLYAIGKGELSGLPESAGKPEETTKAGGADTLLNLAEQPIGPSEGVSKMVLQDSSGFSGKLAVDPDGVVYLASVDGTLYAMDPSGAIRWKVQLPAGAVGGPVLNRAGVVYIADKTGGLSAFTKDGDLVWRVESPSGLKGIAGAAVGLDGTLYYTVGTSAKGSLRAVSPAGEPLWLVESNSSQFYTSPEPSPDGKMIFFRNEIYAAKDGSRLDLNLDFDVDRYFTGKDGRTYLLAGGTVAEWYRTGQGIEIAEDRVLSSEGKPIDVGVTEQGVVWMLYRNGVSWYAKDGQALGIDLLDDGHLTHVVGVDRDFTVYACGIHQQRLFEGKPSCFALSPGSAEPKWIVEVGDRLEEINGGVLLMGKIYISTEEGRLYLIGKN